MSAVEELSIDLEHDIDEQYQYQPGEVVRGKVRIKVVRPTAIRTVTIRAVGEGNVSWKDDEDDNDTTTRGGGSINQAEEKYVDASKVILDTKSQPPRNLQPGYSEFPFEYPLPENLPSSYIGKFGNVTYTMKATVTGVKSIDTSITSEPFLVLRRSPLPESAEQQVTLQQGKRLWASCSFGKVQGEITLESRGGVPGEDLFMQAEIKNHSQRTVTAMQASLVMLSTYTAQRTKTSFRQIVSKKRDEFDVEHNEGRRWNFVRLTLPPYIPETRLEFCDIIDIHYVFQFRVEIAGGAELKMETPILVGSHLPGQTGSRPLQGAAPSANNHWHVGARGFILDDEGVGSRGMRLDGGGAYRAEGEEDYEPQSQWGVDSGVPELRGDKVVINNPLFRHGSTAVTRPANGAGGTPRNGDLGGGKDRPQEMMENTRL